MDTFNDHIDLTRGIGIRYGERCLLNGLLVAFAMNRPTSEGFDRTIRLLALAGF